mmetsp:Transcript_25855/g.57946  ORF Transcript_25855/g.57946 Transcript_25855/m.57946 type:complete len:122 (-) Transcript_25855:746-1111(-)
MWADWLIRAIPAKLATVVLDSFVGYFPPRSQGPLFRVFGGCGSAPLNGFPGQTDLEAECDAGNLTLQAVVSSALAEHPSVAFAHVSSKTDAIQISFYVAIGALNTSLDASITPEVRNTRLT